MAARNKKIDNMNYWVVVYRFAWGLLFVVLVVGLVCIFLPKCHFLREMQRKKEKQVVENRELGVKVSNLRTKQDRFNTDQKFVERIARDEGLIKSDEVVFKFTSTNSMVDSGN